ncbi:hypothetical protein [Brevibacillus daliensis]|nr:hypothetical protein [Brevibacillus daliensis]
MNTSAVFQYFFAIGSGVAAGVSMILAVCWMVYSFVTKKRVNKKKGAH